MANEIGAHVPETDSTLARPIGWWLKEADARLDAAFDRALDGHGLDRRGWQVLSWLARRPSREADLAEALVAFDPRQVIHEVVVDLSSRGWVTAGEDGLRLTEEGAQQHAAIAPLIDQVRQRVRAALPGSDYVTLVRLLQRLTEAV